MRSIWPVHGRVVGLDVEALLSTVDWASITPGSGGGAWLEGQLRRLMTLEPGAERDQVLGDVWDDVLHQGTVSPATAPALPVLVTLAEAAEHPLRAHLLALVAACSFPFDRGGVPATDDDPARLAIRALLPRLVTLARDDVVARCWVAVAMAAVAGPNARATVELLQRWRTTAEPDERVVYELAMLLAGDRSPATLEARTQWVGAADEDSDTDAELVRELLAAPPPGYDELAAAASTLFYVALASWRQSIEQSERVTATSPRSRGFWRRWRG